MVKVCASARGLLLVASDKGYITATVTRRADGTALVLQRSWTPQVKGKRRG